MSDSDPSIRDAEYLAKLQDYYASWKSIPSYAALCDVFGIASKSWVKAILDRLEKAGFVERTPDGMWIPSRQFFARPRDRLVQQRLPSSRKSRKPSYPDRFRIFMCLPYFHKCCKQEHPIPLPNSFLIPLKNFLHQQ